MVLYNIILMVFIFFLLAIMPVKKPATPTKKPATPTKKPTTPAKNTVKKKK